MCGGGEMGKNTDDPCLSDITLCFRYYIPCKFFYAVDKEVELLSFGNLEAFIGLFRNSVKDFECIGGSLALENIKNINCKKLNGKSHIIKLFGKFTLKNGFLSETLFKIPDRESKVDFITAMIDVKIRRENIETDIPEIRKNVSEFIKKFFELITKHSGEPEKITNYFSEHYLEVLTIATKNECRDFGQFSGKIEEIYLGREYSKDMFGIELGKKKPYYVAFDGAFFDDKECVRCNADKLFVVYPDVFDKEISKFIDIFITDKFSSLWKFRFQKDEFLNIFNKENVFENQRIEQALNNYIAIVKNYINKLERNDYFYFTITKSLLAHMEKYFLNIFSTYMKLKESGMSICSHYKNLLQQNKGTEKKSSGFANKIAERYAKLINNIEAAVKYTEDNLKFAEMYRRIFNEKIEYYEEFPPDLIKSEAKKKQTALPLLKVRFCCEDKEKICNINVFYPKEDDINELSIRNSYFYSLIGNKESAVLLIKAISYEYNNFFDKFFDKSEDPLWFEDFIEFLEGNKPDKPRYITVNKKYFNDDNEISESGSLIKKSLNSILLAISDINDSNDIVSKDIKDRVKEDMGTNLFLLGLIDHKNPLYFDEAFKIFQNFSQYSQINKFLDAILQIKDRQKNGGKTRFSLKKFLKMSVRSLLSLFHIGRLTNQKDMNNNWKAKLYSFAFKYYVSEYDISRAIDLIPKAQRLPVIKFLKFIWADTSAHPRLKKFTLYTIFSVLFLTPLQSYYSYYINHAEKLNYFWRHILLNKLSLGLFSFLWNVADTILILLILYFIFIVGVSMFFFFIRRKCFSSSFNLERIFLPRLIGAIIVGLFGATMADIVWTIAKRLLNMNLFVYYFWISFSLLGTLLFFYYKINAKYESEYKAFLQSVRMLFVGIIYSYLLSFILVSMIFPVKREGFLKIVTLSGSVGKLAFMRGIIQWVSPFHILFFSSFSLLLGAALQLLWSPEDITEEF